MANYDGRADEYGELQEVVDALYADDIDGYASTVDLYIKAEAHDLCDDLMEVINTVPAGRYKKAKLVDQMNSIITAHGWGFVYGTLE